MRSILLQIRPGEDPTLVAGLIRVILEEELHDADFCQRYVEGLEELRSAVDGFTLSYVAERTGIPAELVQSAARLFAKGPRGTRKLNKRHMLHNDACPEIRVNPQTFDVTVDGELATCEPAQSLPLTQRYMLR